MKQSGTWRNKQKFISQQEKPVIINMNPDVNVIHISPTDISQWKNESGGAFLDPMIDAAQTTK